MLDIIIGTGNEYLDAMIREDVELSGIGKVVGIVTTRKTLLKRISEKSPDMIFIGDELLGESKTKEESDIEWEQIIEDIRKFSYKLRIVFFCEREENDLFLTKLTTFSISDIFNEGALPKDYINQLANEPNFQNIVRFRNQVEKVSEEMKNKKIEEKIKAAEEIIVTGVRPQEGRVIEKIVPVYQQFIIQPKLIVFASAFEGAGSSSIAKMFAEYLATLNLHIGLVESPYSIPYWFDAIDGEVRVKNDWKSWFSSIDHDYEISKGSDIEMDSVTYIVKHPNDKLKKWELLKTAYLIGYARQIPILVYDMSHNLEHEHERIILKQADHVFITTTYDPVRVNRTVDAASVFKEQVTKDKLSLIINYSTSTLRKKYESKLINSYNIEGEVFYFPYIEELALSLIEGNTVWKYFDKEDQFKNDLLESIESMAELVIGKELLMQLSERGKKPKKWSFFKKR
jgi:hypothetical protein